MILPYFNYLVPLLIIKPNPKKMKNLSIVLILFFTSLFISCSKGDSTPATLKGNWSVNTVIEKENGRIIDTYNGISSDYLNFKTNGILAYNIDGEIDEVPYSINGNIVTIDSEDYTMTGLSSKTVTLTLSETFGGIRYETVANLKR